MLRRLILYISGGIYSLKSTPNVHIFYYNFLKEFFNAPFKRVTYYFQKKKHHYSFRQTHFNICVTTFSNKKIHCNRAGHQFFNAPCKRVTSSLKKRKHDKWFPVMIWLLIILKYRHRFYKCLTYEWRVYYQAQWNTLNILKFHILNDYIYIHTYRINHYNPSILITA